MTGIDHCWIANYFIVHWELAYIKNVINYFVFVKTVFAKRREKVATRITKD